MQEIVKTRTKVKIRQSKGAVLTVQRAAFENEQLVYLLVANKQVRYKLGRSSIVYIGSTKVGLARVAASVAYKGRDALKKHGVRSLDVHTFGFRSSASATNGKMWKKLERACLLVFRAEHQQTPIMNVQGSRITERDEFSSFTKEGIRRRLKKFESTRKPQRKGYAGKSQMADVAVQTTAIASGAAE